jgi:hypothetical protein
VDCALTCSGTGEAVGATAGGESACGAGLLRVLWVPRAADETPNANIAETALIVMAAAVAIALRRSI